MKIEAEGHYERLLSFYQPTRRHIPEHSNFLVLFMRLLRPEGV